ncbi:MAG TPA: hypothetical protein VK658_14470 [Chryseolinea sp.]|nr:hypothetical protein [Chryseolinea sp.]
MSWLRNIARSGLLDADEYQKKRGILLTNYISLLLCACLILLFTGRRLVFGHIPGGMNLRLLSVGILFFACPIVLNRSGFTTASRLLLCYFSVCFIWYAYISLMTAMTSIEQASYDSARIHLVAISFIPYLLLDKRKPHLLILGILPTLISLLFFDRIFSQFGLGIDQHELPGQESVLMGMRTLVGYCIVSVGCFTFQSIITYNDEVNRKMLLKLKLQSEQIKAQNEEIQSQNEELLASQEKLNEINHHLEDMVLKKTASIKLQNEKILKYAYSNAHHVRGPIARILGLIQVSKLKTDLNYLWFFEKVEHETKQVDTIVASITKELDGIDQSEL